MTPSPAKLPVAKVGAKLVCSYQPHFHRASGNELFSFPPLPLVLLLPPWLYSSLYRTAKAFTRRSAAVSLAAPRWRRAASSARGRIVIATIAIVGAQVICFASQAQASSVNVILPRSHTRYIQPQKQPSTPPPQLPWQLPAGAGPLPPQADEKSGQQSLKLVQRGSDAQTKCRRCKEAAPAHSNTRHPLDRTAKAAAGRLPSAVALAASDWRWDASFAGSRKVGAAVAIVRADSICSTLSRR